MPDRKHKQAQDQTANSSKTAQHQIGREVDARQTQDQSREYVQLRDKVAEKQQNAQNRHVNDEQTLKDQHSHKRQELTSVHAAERPEITATREADQKAEVAALEHFQQTQREQLVQHQQLENQVLSQQMEAITALSTQHQTERDNLQQEQYELTRLCYFQNQLLKDYRTRLTNQMDQDQSRLQEALYPKNPAVNRSQDLGKVLAEQEKRGQLLAQSVQKALKLLTKERDIQKAQYGDLNPYSRQKLAIRDANRRQSEHEHIMARINLYLQTLNSDTGNSIIDRKAYRDMMTLTIAREMALEKTKWDMELRDQLKEAWKTGTFSPELIEAMRLDADVERTKQAREKIIASRLAQEKTFEDLLLSTNEKIQEAAVLQLDELFKLGTLDAQAFMKKLFEEVTEKEADEEIEQAINSWLEDSVITEDKERKRL